MKELREDAVEWDAEARSLERMGGLAPAARTRREEASRLREQARALRPSWRMENLEVYEVRKRKATGRGTRMYTYWHVSWREGNRIVSKYLGSTRRLSREEALKKARQMKVGALGVASGDR